MLCTATGATRRRPAWRCAPGGWRSRSKDPARYSSSLTAVLVGAGNDADEVRRVALDRYDLSLGAGLGRLAGRVFRIGHLGALNDLMLAGTLCGIELSLARAGVGTGAAASTPPSPTCAETEAALAHAQLPLCPRRHRQDAGVVARPADELGAQRGGRARWCRPAGAHRAYLSSVQVRLKTGSPVAPSPGGAAPGALGVSTRSCRSNSAASSWRPAWARPSASRYSFGERPAPSSSRGAASDRARAVLAKLRARTPPGRLEGHHRRLRAGQLGEPGRQDGVRDGAAPARASRRAASVTAACDPADTAPSRRSGAR